MSVWPSTLPSPLRAVNIYPGKNTESTRQLSGRRTIRNWGHRPPDRATVQFRIHKNDVPAFIYFWHRTGMDVTWFTASWLTSIGYTDHKARILGYPRRKGLDVNWSDFAVTLLIAPSAYCVDGSAWLSATTGVVTPPVITWYNINTAVFEQSFAASSAFRPLYTDFAFGADGAKLLVRLRKNSDSKYYIVQYDLTTAWDISTAVYAAEFYDPNLSQLVFSSNGLKMYIAGGSGVGIKQFSLTAVWGVATAVYETAFHPMYVPGHSGTPYNCLGFFFSSDGKKLYCSGSYSTYYIWQYTLTTAWDVSTAVYADKYASVSSGGSLFFSNDGDKMIICQSGYIYQYSLTTAWDISSLIYDDISFYKSGALCASQADGKLYLSYGGFTSDSFINQYSLGI